MKMMSIWKSNNIVEWKFIVSYDFRNPTCDELNTIMAEVRLLHCIVNDTDAKNKCMFFSLIHHLNVFGWFQSGLQLQMLKLQVDVDHNGKVDLREFVVMMYNQVDAINR